MRPSRRPMSPVLIVALLLSACGGKDAAPVDASATDANLVDPLLASVVNDPLMTDLQLTSRSNAGAIRPPDMPPTLMVPIADVAPVQPEARPVDDAPCTACASARTAPTLAALAARQADARMQACAPALAYSATWGARFADDLPLPASARVVEAGGVDGARCTLRAAAFTAAVTPSDLAQGYASVAERVGYAVARSSGGGETLLTGRRTRDGAAFTLYVRDAGRLGAEARLVANTGS